MKNVMIIRLIMLIVVALLPLTTPPALAGNSDPLFINLTSDDGHRSEMALGFGMNQLIRGHKLTVFLNDHAVRLAATANKNAFATQQKMLGDLVAKGATIYVCPSCMKYYGVPASDLLPGLKVSSPDLSGAALFEANTKTLSW